MRETLTAIAIVLIVLLTAALAAPYFVDWNSQRGFLEARLSHALGQKVTIGGAIDLKLLPTPYLVLDQAVIGGDDGPITMGIRHLDLELSVAPLIHGEFEIVEARLEEPTIRVTLQRDRSLPNLPEVPVLRADVRFDRIAVKDGTVAIADPLSGRTFAVEHLDLEAEVDSIPGPFKGSGSAGSASARTNFRFASSTAQSGRPRLRLIVDETPAHAGLDLDGSVMFSGGTKDSVRETFDGQAAIFGHLKDGGDSLMPWRLSGPVHADPLQAALTSGELRLGTEDHALILTATGTASFTETATARLTVRGKQIDLDRLLGGGVSATGEVTKPRYRDVAAWRRALSESAPPIPTAVDIAVDSAIVGGETLGDVAIVSTLGADGAAPLRVSGTGPGGSHVALAGRWTQDLQDAQNPSDGFDGLFDFSAADLSTVTHWVSTIAPDVSWPGDDLIGSATAKGHVVLSDAGIEATGLALRLGRSALNGSARYAPPQADRAGLFVADLKAEALDLDTVPDLAKLRTAARSTDLDLKLEARAIKVARFGDGPVDAGRIRLALTKKGGAIAVPAFRIEGLGGTTLDATGTLDAGGGAFDAKLDAQRLGDAAALYRRVAPGALSDAFAARAAAIVPAKVAISGRLTPLETGGFTLAALTLNGTLAATKLDATLSPDPAAAGKVVANATIAAAEGSILLRQLGFATLPLDNLGLSRVTVAARGVLAGSLTSTIHAAIGGTTVDSDLTLDLAAATQRGSGALKLVSTDMAPILQSAALAFPDFLGRLPADLRAGIEWTPGTLSFSDLKGKVADTAISGSLVWHLGKVSPALSGAVTLDKLSLATLFALPLGAAQPAPARALWSNLPFGTGLVDPPSAEVALQIKAFDIGMGLAGQAASVDLRLSQGLLALHNLKAHAGGGAILADLSIRRDAANATLQGKLSVDKVRLGLPSVQGVLSGTVDLAGGGRSAQALVASLAGSGSATIDTLQIPGADPAALPSVFDDVEADRVSVDEEAIVRALEDAGHQPLMAGTRLFSLGLASGVLHFDAKRRDEPANAPPVASVVSASLDITKPAIDTRVEQVLHALPKDWSGPPPQVVIALAGPLDAPVRTIDVSAFLNALAARALARESARIEAYEYDVRERAFFNQRLQLDRAHEQDRVKVEEDARLAIEAARKAEADKRAAEIAAKQEKARKEAQEKAAQIRAAQERAIAQERALQERALQERALQERAAAQERALQNKILEDRQRQLAPSAGQTPEAQPGADALGQPAFQSPGNPADPSAAGRY